MNNNAGLSVAVRQLRKSMGLTQAAFAERIQVDKITVSRYENGWLSPGWKTLSRLGRIAENNVPELRDVFLGPISEFISSERVEAA